MKLNVVGVIQRDDKYLLIYHKKLNIWLFPGGNVDNDETPDKTIIREIKEELGIDCRIILNDKFTISAKTEHNIDLPEVITYSNNTLHFLYLLETDNIEFIVQEDEISKPTFFTKEEILALETLESVKQFINQL